MRLGTLPLLSCALMTALALPAAAQAPGGDAAAGKRKTVTCNGCHAQAAMSSVPNLGGQAADYFVAAMEAYHDGVRTHPTMRDVAKAFSLRDFKNFAAYYADAPPAADAAPAVPPAAAERCTACHGPAGAQPVTKLTPRLAGQKAPYLAQALREYRDGVRKHAIMQPHAQDLNDDEIAALSNYFAGLPGLSVK
jgi:cytochrome c553